MNLNDYFDPVSLERPEYQLIEAGSSFSHHLSIHTPDQAIRDLDKHQVALIGLPEDRGGFVKGSANAPNAIRNWFYQLRHPRNTPGIYDLGNIKTGGSLKDSYYALREVLTELRSRKIGAILMGGSQDLAEGVFMTLEKEAGLHHVLSVDAMLDFLPGYEKESNSRTHLNSLLKGKRRKQFSLTNLGHQACMLSDAQLDEMANFHLESIRLGEAKNKIRETEPLIRESAFVCVDLCAVRQADAPGSSTPSPNGFTSDELCQIARYAGLSEKVNIIGFFECNPEKDPNGQTAHLTAQAIWYFIDGLLNRMEENPVNTPQHIKKFIVNLDAAGHDISFYKSSISGRWWMEIPVKNPASGHNFFVSCSYEDYRLACKEEIPDRWWRYLNRLERDAE